MAEHELSARISGNTPPIAKFLGSLSGEVAYRGKWQTARGERFIAEAGAEAGLTVEQLSEKAEAAQEKFGDLLLQLLNRATQVGDVEYHTVLARLVAAACDSDQIDKVSYVAAQLSKLEPVEVRGLLVTRKLREIDFTREELAEALGIPPTLAGSILQTLFALDLATNLEAGIGEDATLMNTGGWTITEWGHDVLRLIRAHEGLLD